MNPTELRPIDFDIALSLLLRDRGLLAKRGMPGAASLIHDAILRVADLRDQGRREADDLLDLCWPQSKVVSVDVEND